MNEKNVCGANGASQEILNAFIMMPFGSDDEGETVSKKVQDALFYLVLFGLNDAYYQNYINRSVRKWKPINLERADIGVGRSVDLLENVLRKIDESDFCVVDCTFNNMNVALECGYAMANNKFIIQLQRPKDDIKLKQGEEYQMPHISDLSGKLMQDVKIKPLMDHKMWPDVSEIIQDSTILFNQAKYFSENKDKIAPFTDNKEAKETFLYNLVLEKSKGKDIVDLRDFQSLYRKFIVRPLYSVIRPLSEKLDSGATEVEYTCKAYASRDDANFPGIFSKAKNIIKILTTNLQGLEEYIDSMEVALSQSQCNKKVKLEVLTLNPDSEFVNARGKLIGKEIARFRTEMSESLRLFITKLYQKYPNQVTIKIYSEFPTQITYFVDNNVYSSVVSVNHQSRKNMVFEVSISRKGVAESFLQHWDTIWARATEVLAPRSGEQEEDRKAK
ncbi:MAG: hypothetical protein JSV88_33695 [Candidatus Aminicenantes bacterium]|nr:MAG: hypothetical protein JSV88_33695 [Candidatus Aminicenantes bacterium]